VVDANILFSALLKAGLTRRLWFHPGLECFCPEFILREALKHDSELRQKYKGGVGDYERLRHCLLRQVRIVPDDVLKPYLPAAAALSGDKNDWLYLACALAVDAPIWSNDKEFKKQKRVKTFSTAELMNEVGLL